MLKQLRDKGSSVVVKILIGLLVLSFAAWGVGDIFAPDSPGQSVASAGKTEITQQEFIIQLRQQEAGLRQRGFSPEMLGSINLPGAVLDQLVTRATYEEEARQMKLVPTVETISRTIRQIPEFHDATGKFDRSRYQFALTSQGYGSAYFETLVAKDIVANMLLDSVTAGVVTSNTETKTLYKFQKETRDISYITFKVDEDEFIANPTDEGLKFYYEVNKEYFRAPDFRKVSYIAVDVEMIANDITVPEAEALAYYEQNLDAYISPEMRGIQLMLLSDQETALAAKEEIEAEKSFVQVAAETANQGEDEINLGLMTRREIPDENLSAAAFALEVGAVSNPIETPFGWHLVTVTDIQPQTTIPFADVEADIRQILAHEQAVDMAYDYSNQLDDAIGGGATLEEAAAQTGLDLVTIERLDAMGRDTSGDLIAGLPNPASFVKFAFETEEGLDSLLQDDGADGFFILRVDGLIPSHLKLLEEVREEAIALWISEKRRNLAQAKADAVLTQLNEGAKLSDIANGDVAVATDIARPAVATGQTGLPASLVQSLFDAKVNAAAIGFAEDTYYVGQLDRINIPADSAYGAVMMEIEEATLASITSDIIQQYNMALRARHSVRVNQGLVNNLSNLEY